MTFSTNFGFSVLGFVFVGTNFRFVNWVLILLLIQCLSFLNYFANPTYEITKGALMKKIKEHAIVKSFHIGFLFAGDTILGFQKWKFYT